jgi:hypothetical protein
VLLEALGDDNVGYRISLFRIPPQKFGTENLPLRYFAQEIVNHYPLGTLKVFNSAGNDTKYISSLRDSYENDWYA